MAATKRSSSIKVISPKGASLSKGAVSKGSSVSKGAAPKATSSTKAAPALNRPLIEKAVSSLLKHHAAQQDANNASTALLDVGASANVSLQFGLAKILQSHGGGGGSKGKPISIPLKHPMYNVHQGEDGEDDTAMNTTDDNSLENVDICLIVKGTSKADIQAMVDRFPSHLGCIKKILTLESLRQKFKEYKHKRELHSRYDLFVVDDRVLPMLGRQLGHKFFKAGNKQGCPPIPINVTRTEAFPFAIQKILKSTYLTIPAGTCVGVRIGTTSMDQSKLVDNVLKATLAVGETLPGSWKNVLSVAIKTTKSMALPFYNKSYDELKELARLSGEPMVDGAFLKGDDGQYVATTNSADATATTTATSTKKRGAEEDAPKTPTDKSSSKKKAKKDTPLVAALKLQKSAEKEALTAKSTTTTMTTKATPQKKRKASMDKAEEPAVVASPAKATPSKAASAPKSSVKKSEKKRKTEEQAPKPAESVEAILFGSPSKATPTKKAAVVEKKTPATPKSSATKNKKGKTTEAVVAVAAAKVVEKPSTPTPTKEKALFVPQKKYSGSKAGYVFTSGLKGVGYYMDKPSKVDKAAIQAMVGSRGGGGNKKGGGRTSMSGKKQQVGKNRKGRRSF